MDLGEKILRFIDLVCALILTCITLIVFYEVLSRYLLNRPWPLSGELVLLLFPWMIFLASISITNRQQHLNVTFFKDLLPAKVKRVVTTTIRALTVVFAAIMLKSGIDLTIVAVDQRLPVLPISKLWLYVSMPLCFFAIIVIAFLEVVHHKRKSKHSK